jgi:LysM repeat protein
VGKNLHLCSPNLVSMKKCFSPFLALLLMAHFAIAQKPDLMIKSGDKGLYLEHKVAAKESFFAIGRLYNVHPKALASYNKLDMTKGLVIGQAVRIPLTDTNFTQKGNTGTPVYYKTGENEGLMKVSNTHNNVLLQNLRDWNSLAADNIPKGSKLVVGFLLSKEMPAVTLKGKAAPATEPVKEAPVVVTAPKEETIKSEPVVEIKKEEPKPEPKKAEPVFAKQEEKTIPASSENGYFKYHFEQQVKTSPVSKDATVTSGIFKTTSGWLDAKYYLLIDAVPPGTIVKITSPSNNKVIYAKVLGGMAGIRQNEGFDIRISSAAASALQVTEQDKFIVKVNY